MMNNVIGFPSAHAQALGKSRAAANSVNLSDVRPASRAHSVERIADHLSDGMLLRCRHLATAGARAPISDAKASGEGQRSTTSWNELISLMPAVLGPIVLKRKDKMTLDAKKRLGHTVPMVEPETEAQFKQAFTSRIKAARIAATLKQWQIADLLGIPQDKYKQYEGRSLLPHALVGRFCTICRVNPEWLFTGSGQKQLKPPHLVASDELQQQVPKPKRIRRSSAA